MRRRISSSTISRTKPTISAGRIEKISMLFIVHLWFFFEGKQTNDPEKGLAHYFALAASSSRRALSSVRFKTKPAPELLVREESIQNSPSNKAFNSTAETSSSFPSRQNPSALSIASR